MEGEEEIDKLSFTRWCDILQSGMALAGISDEETKSNIFKMKAGSKLLDILDNRHGRQTRMPRMYNCNRFPTRCTGFANISDRAITFCYNGKSYDHCRKVRRKPILSTYSACHRWPSYVVMVMSSWLKSRLKSSSEP